MYPSSVTGYQDPLSLKAFLSYLSMSLSSFINLVAKVNIFIKLIMYVLSQGCLLNLYNAFFHLHTWLCMSCDFTSSGCKCLFVVYAFFSWKASCYEYCLVSHDVFIYCIMELWTFLHVSILHSRHHSLELVFPFFLVTSSWLEGSASMMSLHPSYYSSSWTVVTCSSEQVSSFFACRRLCMRSFLQVKCICMVRNISPRIFILENSYA